MKTIIYEHPALEYSEHGNGIEVSGKNEVCYNCEGTGVTTRSDLDDSALIDSMQEDGDFEGIEGYYNGNYDEVCQICKGKNVIFMPILPEWAEILIQEWEHDKYMDEQYSAQERRMGA